MTLSHAAYAPQNTADQDLLVFQQMNEALSRLAGQPKLMAQKFLENLQNKMEERKMSFQEIREKLQNNPQAKVLFDMLLPSEKAISESAEHSKFVDAQLTQLDSEKKAELAQSLKNIEKTGFLEGTWEKMKEISGNVIDGAFSLIKSIPGKYVTIAVALIVLLGSVSAVLAFLHMGQAASSTATFGALKSMFGITPETFSSMAEPLIDILSAGPAMGLPA